eukprot:73180-Amphidinium_carterae.2
MPVQILCYLVPWCAGRCLDLLVAAIGATSLPCAECRLSEHIEKTLMSYDLGDGSLELVHFCCAHLLALYTDAAGALGVAGLWTSSMLSAHTHTRVSGVAALLCHMAVHWPQSMYFGVEVDGEQVDAAKVNIGHIASHWQDADGRTVPQIHVQE